MLWSQRLKKHRKTSTTNSTSNKMAVVHVRTTKRGDDQPSVLVRTVELENEQLNVQVRTTKRVDEQSSVHVRRSQRQKRTLNEHDCR
jgi:cobalamin biosynthesis protein CbiD